MEIKYYTSPWCVMCKLQKWKVDDINSFFDNKIEFIDISNDEWYNDAVANNIM